MIHSAPMVKYVVAESAIAVVIFTFRLNFVPSSVMPGLIRHPVANSGASFLDSGLRRNDGGEACIHRLSVRQPEYYYDNRSNNFLKANVT
jgi:hypothetical protein